MSKEYGLERSEACNIVTKTRRHFVNAYIKLYAVKI